MAVIAFNAEKTMVMLGRCNRDTKEEWSEILNLNEIASIQENRCGKSVYQDNPGKRRGYLVYLKGGNADGFWINDDEYIFIVKALGFNEVK